VLRLPDGSRDAEGAVVLASLIALSPVALYTGSAPGRNAASEACQALAGLRIDDTKVVSAAVVPASGDLPEYCRVLGYVRNPVDDDRGVPEHAEERSLFRC